MSAPAASPWLPRVRQGHALGAALNTSSTDAIQTSTKDKIIRQKLESFSGISLTTAMEDVVIKLRQTRKTKLPGAASAATALYAGLELLTAVHKMRDAKIMMKTSSSAYTTGASSY